MQPVYLSRDGGNPPGWYREYVVGAATVTSTADGVRLHTRNTARRRYADSQLDDNHSRPRREYAWQPPLRLTARARFSHNAAELRGTAGFGFWNYPINNHQLPTLPRALWFFCAAPPNDIKLDYHTPGAGWLAMTLDSLRLPALALAPVAPLVLALCNIPAVYPWVWGRVQRALGASSALVPTDMTAWHIYTLDWGTRHVAFRVDGQPVVQYAPSPRGPLCFVAWVDNQYAQVTPQGKLGWGLLDIPGEQWMELDWLAIEPATR